MFDCTNDLHTFSPSFVSQIFADKAAKRAVLSLGVKCSNWKRKCDWVGDLIYVEVRPNNHSLNHSSKIKAYGKILQCKVLDSGILLFPLLPPVSRLW